MGPSCNIHVGCARWAVTAKPTRQQNFDSYGWVVCSPGETIKVFLWVDNNHRQNVQRSLYNTNTALVFGEIPQNYHTFASSLIASKSEMGPMEYLWTYGILSKTQCTVYYLLIWWRSDHLNSLESFFGDSYFIPKHAMYGIFTDNYHSRDNAMHSGIYLHFAFAKVRQIRTK